MFKVFKILVPAIQVLIAVAVFGSSKLCHNERLQYYVYPVKDLVAFVNLPVVIVWILMGFALAGLNAYLPATGRLLAVWTILLALMLVSSVGLFWYLVVAEIELRVHGKSMLRFSGWFGEVFTVAAFCLGVGTLFYGYHSATSVWYYRRAEGIAEGTALAVWGTVFIAVAVSDLVTGPRKD